MIRLIINAQAKWKIKKSIWKLDERYSNYYALLDGKDKEIKLNGNIVTYSKDQISQADFLDKLIKSITLYMKLNACIEKIKKVSRSSKKLSVWGCESRIRQINIKILTEISGLTKDEITWLNELMKKVNAELIRIE